MPISGIDPTSSSTIFLTAKGRGVLPDLNRTGISQLQVTFCQVCSSGNVRQGAFVCAGEFAPLFPPPGTQLCQNVDVLRALCPTQRHHWKPFIVFCILDCNDRAYDNRCCGRVWFSELIPFQEIDIKQPCGMSQIDLVVNPVFPGYDRVWFLPLHEQFVVLSREENQRLISQLQGVLLGFGIIVTLIPSA